MDSTASLDRLCAEAVEIARAAALEVGGAEVGEHVDVSADDELLATHYFACLSSGYRGWRWAVTVARAPETDVVTVCEAVLLPGEAAVLSTDWVPYDERVLPGDLGPGDLLPYKADDPRLAPAYTDVDADDAPVVDEIGFGRARVLSLLGRDLAAERWYDGDRGPYAPIAKSAPGPCATCGFYYRLTGGLGSLFGACTNGYAPDDGRVVSVDHGCGAHSEAVPDIPLLPEPPPVILDDLAIDMVTRDGGAVADSEAETNTATEPEADVDTATESEARADTALEPEAETALEPEAETALEPEAEVDAPEQGS